MSVNNLTELNDCDNVTGFTDSNKTPGLNTDAGQRYEGSGSISVQHTNTAGGNEMDTTQTSGGGGTFSVDMSDRTYYFQLKDNLVNTFTNAGVMAVLGDGTDKVGFAIGGNNAVGMTLPPFYNIYKLDASNLPSGNNTTFTGVEGNLTLTAITAMGVGTVHIAKAQGNVDNLFFDKMSHIANDSYALTINGGTAGTPEEMSGVVGDDVTNGWGLVSNPVGKQYIFFGPTEWGNVSNIAEHAFTADGEQWFWIGDNAGGQGVGSTHFPFRLISNSTDTGSFIIDNVVIVNTGTRVQLLMDNTDFNTIEINGCSFTGLDTIALPSSGGTSRFITNTIFSNCGQLTHNGADMSGSSVLVSSVSTGVGAVFYNETADPDGEMDNMTFSKGTTDHSAIEFGTAVTANITLRGIDFTLFGSTNDVDGAVFKFLATTGSLNLSLVGCTTDGTFSVDDSAGIDVTVVIDPVTTLVHVTDNNDADLQNAVVFFEASDNLGDLPFEESVTIARASTTATVTHTSHGMAVNDKFSLKGITDKVEDNSGTQTIVTSADANTYTYTTTDSGSTSYTGTIISTGVVIEGTTDVNGDISDTRTWSGNTDLVGVVRKATGAPFFKDFPISGTVDTSAGLVIGIKMQLDQ